MVEVSQGDRDALVLRDYLSEDEPDRRSNETRHSNSTLHVTAAIATALDDGHASPGRSAPTEALH
jgi:hypothetical protein